MTASNMGVITQIDQGPLDDGCFARTPGKPTRMVLGRPGETSTSTSNGSFDSMRAKVLNLASMGSCQ